MTLWEDVDDNLREKLVAAKLAGTRDGDGYRFQSNEQAADKALKEVAAWLRRMAYRHRARAEAKREDGRHVHPPSLRESFQLAATRYDILAERVLGTYDVRRGPEIIREAIEHG